MKLVYNNFLIIVKPCEFLTSRGYHNEHAGCDLFVYEKNLN